MHLGTVADPSIGYDPQPIAFRPEAPAYSPTFSADGGTKVDPATAILLIDEFGPAVVTPSLPAPPVFVPSPEEKPIGDAVIIGGAALLVVGALWYFNR